MTDLCPSTAGKENPLPYWLLAASLSFLLSLFVVVPFFCLGTASGHDFEFHADSWMDAASQWKQGIIYPRWTVWTNHGFGEPRFIFYPPLSWMIGAALSLLAPGAAVPILFILLIQTLAGVTAFGLLRRLANQRAAILGAACYVINPNALLITYVRSDFAEQLACALFPLLFLAALRLSGLLEEDPPKLAGIVSFGVPFAAVWLSNAPAGVIASYAMMILFAWAAVSQRSSRILFRGAAGLALGMGLAGFYIVPAAYEQRWVNISQALSNGLLPAQNFLFTRIEDPEHTWFNWMASCCALALSLLLGLSALASRRFSSPGVAAGRARKANVSLMVVAAAALFLMLRVSGFLWVYLPKLRFIQFPWRWMSIVALISSCFAAAAMEKRRGWLWFAALLAFTLPLGYFLVANTWWDTDEMPALQDAISTGAGFEGTDEYDPLGDDHLDLPLHAPLGKLLPSDSANSPMPQRGLQIQKWTAEQKEIQIDSPVEARLALRVLNYPAWRVEVNGKIIVPERMDDVNQMVIPVAAGKTNIRVWFARTADRTLGILASSFSALTGVFLLLASRKRREKRA